MQILTYNIQEVRRLVINMKMFYVILKSLQK